MSVEEPELLTVVIKEIDEAEPQRLPAGQGWQWERRVHVSTCAINGNWLPDEE